MFSKFNILSQSSCSKPAHRATLRGGGGKTLLGACKRFGFTLAEVLITLGIIGVVAAMTIPNLITNYQNKAKISKLKKMYSTMQQVVRRSVEENAGIPSIVGITSLDDRLEYVKTYFGQYLNVAIYCRGLDSKMSQCKYPDNSIKDLAGVPSFSPSQHVGIVLNDGSQFLFRFSYDDILRICYDVNGVKLPNKYGIDIFVMEYNLSNEELYPNGYYVFSSEDHSVLKRKRTKEELESNCIANGSYCLAFIMANNWQDK